MTETTTRRRFLATVAALPALSLLGACSDGGDGEARADEAIITGSTAPEPAGTVDMEKLLQPGALPEKALGPEDAPVTIVEYASMTCSHCASFHAHTFPALKEKYIDTGKVHFIMREFPFDPRAEAGFMLARCAEDKYFPMVDVLFKQQNNWAPVQDARAALFNIAKLAGFSQESFEACLTNQKLLDDVRAVRARGAEFGVEATPTFFIDGKKYSGAMSIEQMSAIIDPLL
ncbi:DsbA family protein [Chelativorans sp. AA-79]|uniref:DsbA family protein n=1 Tax=Chelativorans sp. AA-79 TaxID=3028735 RepID=UPI0023F6C5DA|nr:DsbA family protein [Chelativorans sp. AA-79]WEX07808.1 DsbA family protein [Chelativorans sp. AA-79]